MVTPEPLDVLHVSSFVGNIGDNANHNGTRRVLEDNLDSNISYKQSELRKYYENYPHEDSLDFDQDFINKANQYDLVLFGGGSHFEIWLENSATGTTFDLSNDQLSQIETPMVFHGLGCTPEKEVPDHLVDRFRSFLDHAFELNNCLVSVRNDGSIKHIKEHIGHEYAQQIEKIPDGAYFMQVDDHNHPELSDDPNDINICVNVVKNMVYRRFPGENGQLTYAKYVETFSSFLNELLSESENINIIFIPHIYSDQEAISDIYSNLDIWYRRSRISTAPYVHGQGNEKYIYDLYNKSDLSMGQRYHANIPSIALGTPSIGLTTGHPGLKDIYREVDFADRTVDVHTPGFDKQLKTLVYQSLENLASISKSYQNRVDEMKKDIDTFHEKIDHMIKNN